MIKKDTKRINVRYKKGQNKSKAKIIKSKVKNGMQFAL